MSAKTKTRKTKKEQTTEQPGSSRRVLSKDLPLSLVCEWGDCCAAPVEDMRMFIDHITMHLRQAAPNVVTLEEASQSDDYSCEWRGCCKNLADDDGEFGGESYGTFLHLARHVYYHAYHARLKCLGFAVLSQLSLPSCSGDIDHRNTIPELSDRLRCLWSDCKEIQDNAELFYEHVASHMDSLPCGNNPIEQCKCLWEGCTTVVKSKHKMRDHLRSHTQEKVVACPTCGSLFVNTTKFVDHVKRNSNETGCQYQCLHCKKKCSTARLLRDHMRRHVNQYKCPYCDMTCPNKSNLRIHILYRHSEHRPYICDKCDYGAKTAGDLRRHDETHRDDWIVCSNTNCHFKTKFVWEMNKHFSSRHGNRDPALYVCHLCTERYRRGSRLTLHLRRKHQIKWPEGHVRFRYTQSEDGLYRLQTIRYETTELSVQSADSPKSSTPHSTETSNSNNSTLQSALTASTVTSESSSTPGCESSSTVTSESSFTPACESSSTPACESSSTAACESSSSPGGESMIQSAFVSDPSFTIASESMSTLDQTISSAISVKSSLSATIVSKETSADVLSDILTSCSTNQDSSANNIVTISSSDLSSVSGDAAQQALLQVEGYISKDETDGVMILHIGNERYQMSNLDVGTTSGECVTDGESEGGVMKIIAPDGTSYKVIGSIQCSDSPVSMSE